MIKKKKEKLYNVLKIKINKIINDNFNVEMSKNEISENTIKQQFMTMFQQIELIRKIKTIDLTDLIIVEAKKNKKQEPMLTKLIKEGFTFNGDRFLRFGKSSSQAKDGYTIFIKADIYDEAFERTQLGIPIDKCVISKYEAYRNLVFTACKPVELEKIPYIVIVGEFEKTLYDQHVRYVTEEKVEYFNKKEQKNKFHNKRITKEGKRNVKISPFDGFGIHSEEMSKYLGIAGQVRYPKFKGVSVEARFKEYYESKGIKTIPDIYGNNHNVQDIDCIWNTTMFKGHSIFLEHFGKDAWNEYIRRVTKYGYKLGISKSVKDTSKSKKYSRLNFQYLQCLDLWNPQYVEKYKNKDNTYDILSNDNSSKIVNLAKYTTEMYEKIIMGDKFYTYKYLGIEDSEDYTSRSNIMQSILINDDMLKDPAVRSTIKRKLDKSIQEAKIGKIYVEGMYHIVVGDILGYMEFCGGDKNPQGCLKAGEFYTKSMPLGKLASFRSPLVDPSEVNIVNNVENAITKELFPHFENIDLVMINMHDLTLPQQGGMDEDGDAILLSSNKVLIESKIYKPIVIDETDKQTVTPVEYNIDNIVKYELNSRDNRIGEITNVATSILNRQYTKDKIHKAEDDVSLLRLYQGKEIDFIKTGYRWSLSFDLKDNLERLPYFLVYNYPKRKGKYNQINEMNKRQAKEDEHEEIKRERIISNMYHSPSPLNELCDYFENWERRKINWNRETINNKDILINHLITTNNSIVNKQIRKIYNLFDFEFKAALEEEKGGQELDWLFKKYEKYLLNIIEKEHITKDELINHCIAMAYKNQAADKTLCWSLFGDVMIKNLKENSPKNKSVIIKNSSADNEKSYEFLGNYHELVEKEGNE